MSHYMTAIAMRQTGLKPAAKIVLYWLADHHNSETGRCFPSLTTLAKECEMDKATVVRHLAQLEEAGLIRRTHRTRDNGSQTSTEYEIFLQDNLSQNATAPCRKTQQAPVAKCDTLNLGIDNLGRMNQSPLPPKGDRFEEFWSIVPKRIGKGKAQAAWVKACRKADPDTIIAGMQRYANERDGQDQQYTAHPTSWLNAERWTDEYPASQQDFHNMISQALGGTDAISGPRENDHVTTQRLPAPLQEAGPSGPERGADRTAGNGRGNEWSYSNVFQPKRFGGSH